MINPYMQDKEARSKIDYVQNNIMVKPPEMDLNKKMSLTHPYKSCDDVLMALQRGDGSAVDILSKMDPSLRKDPETMLRLIEHTDAAYMYVHKEINTLEFKQLAVMKNPMVYDRLSDHDRKQQEISDAYRNSMFYEHSKRLPMDATTFGMLPEYQFSKLTNVPQVFSEQALAHAAEHVVVNGGYTKENGWTLSPEAAMLAIGGYERERVVPGFLTQQIMKQAWEKHPERVAEFADKDRSHVLVNNALTAIEAQAPEMKRMIEQRQMERWEKQRPYLEELLVKQQQGQKLKSEDLRRLDEAQKHIQITAKQKQATERVEQERMANNAFMIADAKARVYGAMAAGDISYSQAADLVSNIGSAPITSKASASAGVIERAEAIENDIDNVDRDREAYLKVSAKADDPSPIPVAIEQEDAALLFAGQVQAINALFPEVEEDVAPVHAVEPEYNDPEYDNSPELDEEESQYEGLWNYSAAADRVMYQEIQPH